MTRAMTKGDEMAYRNFHEIYFDRLLRYLLVVANGNEEAAREALQLTFGQNILTNSRLSNSEHPRDLCCGQRINACNLPVLI